MTRLRVLLVDDHAVVRAGYRLLLQNEPDIEVVAEADTGELACRRYADLKPDVVVMDLALPGMGGLEAIKRMRMRDPAARILVFSMHEEPMFVERALAAGASGYVPKSSAPEVLVAALKRVAAGNRYLDHGLERRLAFDRVRGQDSPLMELSTREFEIFCLLADGASSAEIARRLSLSPKTVANYSTQLKTKLNAGSAADLARLAIRHGIIRA
jgi:DNA-binding NarL/FixJ family response regulator